MSTEITTPIGRVVGGHPMERRPVIDDKTKLPKLQKDGVTPLLDTYIGLAIAKGQETHWNQTEWGLAIYQAAAVGWPNGEFNSPTFAWKITDGDSAIPNKKGKKPCEKEGFPGHWILNTSTMLAVKCYHTGKYDPSQQIQNKNEIKPGDYARIVIQAKSNNPSESPGVYLNPTLFELSRAGVQIQLDSGPDAVAAFGAVAGVLPANALVDTAVALVPGAPIPGAVVPPVPGALAAAVVAVPPVPAVTVVPAQDFLTPQAGAIPPVPGAPPAPPIEANYNVNGQVFAESALVAAGYTPAQLATLPKV